MRLEIRKLRQMNNNSRFAKNYNRKHEVIGRVALEPKEPDVQQ